VNEHFEPPLSPEHNFIRGNRETVFSTLRRFARPSAALKRCELCSVGLSAEHRHLLEMASGQIVCACASCALRFQAVLDGRFRLIPRDVRTPEKRNKAIYPSPAGATESLLPLHAWNSLVAHNLSLARMEPDVEALLVNRVGSKREHYLAPIDVCFELVGLIRLHWRGLAGGDIVWGEIEKFFSRLQIEAHPLSPISQESSNA
jgi:hypothetical protein